MESDAPIAADPEAEYIFQLPTEDEYINVKGKIVYRESKDGKAPGKYGIEFTDLDKKSLDMIRKFMKVNGNEQLADLPEASIIEDLSGLQGFAENLTKTLVESEENFGKVIFLDGPLGVGKTQLSKFILAFLGYDAEKVFSPTFTICNRYEFDEKLVLHIDLYRLEQEEEIYLAGLTDEVDDSDLLIVEWSEKFDQSIWGPGLKLQMDFDSQQNRILKIIQ